MEYHIIYKTTCTVTSKYYIGMHTTAKLDDGYMGSGIRLRRSLNKYGRDNHIVTILEYCGSREELALREHAIVNEQILLDPLNMNLMIGGVGGFTDAQRQASITARKDLLQNDKEYRDRISATAKISATKVTPNGRLNCANALKERYADPAFKAAQKIHAKAANANSNTPEAHLKRKQNRADKIAKGWIKVIDPVTKKRKWFDPSK